jgi:hypothetical protein
MCALVRRPSKGKPVKIPAPGCRRLHGNVTELGDVGGGPGKSSLFFLTVHHPEISLSGARVQRLAEHCTFAVSGALPTTLENPGEDMFLRQVVLITAAGLQGEKPLVDRTM